VTVRESHVAEERDGRLFVLESHPAEGEPGFERMASAVPVQVLLPLLREVQKARMSPLRLGDACDAQSLELHVEQAVNVGKIVGQPRYPEKLNDLLAEERTVSGIIVPGETPPRFRDQVRAQAVRVGEVERACVARLPALSDGRQVRLEITAVRPVPCPAAEDERRLREAMVKADRVIGVGVERPALLLAIVLRHERVRIPEVGQRIEPLLNFFGDRIDQVVRDAVARKRLIVVERIADRSREVGEISGSPRGQRDRGVEQLQDVAAARGLERKEKEAAVVSVVKLWNDDGTADRAARLVANSGATLRGEGIARAEPG